MTCLDKIECFDTDLEEGRDSETTGNSANRLHFVRVNSVCSAKKVNGRREGVDE